MASIFALWFNFFLRRVKGARVTHYPEVPECHNGEETKPERNGTGGVWASLGDAKRLGPKGTF